MLVGLHGYFVFSSHNTLRAAHVQIYLHHLRDAHIDTCIDKDIHYLHVLTHMHAYIPAGVCNSKALQLAGVDGETPDPVGGIIDRDAKTGRATGMRARPHIQTVYAYCSFDLAW